MQQREEGQQREEVQLREEVQQREEAQQGEQSTSRNIKVNIGGGNPKLSFVLVFFPKFFLKIRVFSFSSIPCRRFS